MVQYVYACQVLSWYGRAFAYYDFSLRNSRIFLRLKDQRIYPPSRLLKRNKMGTQGDIPILKICQQYLKYLPPLRFHKRNKMAHQEGTYQNLEEQTTGMEWNAPRRASIGDTFQFPRSVDENKKKNPPAATLSRQWSHFKPIIDNSQMTSVRPFHAFLPTNGNRSVNCRTIKQEF